MDQSINHIFAQGSYLFLAGLIVAALFFARTGLQELTRSVLEGLLYLALAVFFFCLHFYCLMNLTPFSYLAHITTELNLWTWLLVFLAPGIIVLFLLHGILNLIASRAQAGLIKVFFGLTLFCYLNMLGAGWPVDARAILAICYSYIWFNLELRTA